MSHHNRQRFIIEIFAIYGSLIAQLQGNNILFCQLCPASSETKRDPRTGRFINSKKLHKLENLQKERKATRNQEAEQQPVQATQSWAGARIIDFSC